eukprot:gene15539-21631_t
MAEAEEEEEQLMWLEEEDEIAQPDTSTAARVSEGAMEDTIRSLEAELTRSRKELQDVRKDLAAKTVQLSKKEHVASTVVQERAAEIAATATATASATACEKDRQLQQVVQQMQALEISLAVKEEEVEESRRLYSAQKKALREALNDVAERDASDRAADEASHFAQAQVVEDELDKLQYELVLTKVVGDELDKLQYELVLTKVVEDELDKLQYELALTKLLWVPCFFPPLMDEARHFAQAQLEDEVDRLQDELVLTKEASHFAQAQVVEVALDKLQYELVLTKVVEDELDKLQYKLVLTKASHFAYAYVVADELHKLQYEVVLTKKRAEAELKSKNVEMEQLKGELMASTSNRQQAVANAEAALINAYQEEMESMQASSTAKVNELEAQVLRLRTEMEDQRRADACLSLTGELAMLNNQKVQIQREFESYKDMTIQAARDNREECAKLLSELADLQLCLTAARDNREECAKLLSELADLQSRLAAKSSDALLRPAGSGDMRGAGPRPTPRIFDSLGMESASLYKQGLANYIPQLIQRMEQERKGMLPFIIVSSLVVLVLMIAIIRAAASARSQHGGGTCFLAKLGIRVGKGCGTGLSGAAGEELAAILDKPQRIHDVINPGDEEGDYAGGGAEEDVAQLADVVISNVTEAAKAALRSSRRLAGHLFKRPQRLMQP